MEKLNFKVDPMWFVRTALRIRLENKYNGNDAHPKSTRNALFEYLYEMTDETLEDLLTKHMEIDGVDTIDMEGSSQSRVCEHLEELILKTDTYAAYKFENQRKGRDGLGVADLLTNQFEPCWETGHWNVLGILLKRNHGAYGTLFEQVMNGNEAPVNGVTPDKLDAFITKNFQFVGASAYTRNRIEKLTESEQSEESK